MATYIKIASNTVGVAGVASVTFSSIPSTYTDLLLKVSARTLKVSTVDDLEIRFNGLTTNRSSKDLLGNGAAASSNNYTTVTYIGLADGSTATSNTFSTADIYIPNYASSNYKSYSSDSASETNATTAYLALGAGLWSATAAIDSITVQATSNLVQYTTLTLYGISNA